MKTLGDQVKRWRQSSGLGAQAREGNRRRWPTALFRFWRAPKSLRYQLLSRALLILAALLLLMGGFQYLFMSRFLYQSTAQSVHNQVRTIPLHIWLHDVTGGADGAGPTDVVGDLGTGTRGAGASQSGAGARENATGHGTDTSIDDAGWGERPLPVPFTMPGASVVFIDQQGRFHQVFQAPGASAAPRLPQTEYQAALTYGQADRQYRIVSGANGPQFVVLTPVGPPGRPIGVVQVSADLDQIRHVLMQQLVIFACLAVCALLAAFLALAPTLRRTLVPLSQMVSTVQRINAGNLDERVDLRRAQTEIAVLASAFNAMLERLASAFAAQHAANEKMRRFIADASHELRTPLTSIQGFLEVLQRGAARQPEQLELALVSMRTETERLGKLVQDLLTLARLDDEPTLQIEEGELGALLEQMEPQLRLLAGDRQVQLRAESRVLARFDWDRMKQVVLNLFQNAVQHTHPGEGRIEVSLREDSETVYLTVKDNGTGIPKDQLNHIFERFYRVDEARSRGRGGAGLGLAISQSIVHLHGGSIECESELGVGTTFTVRLPRGGPAGDRMLSEP
jgi:two-component system OmpR family sensor kinase